MRLVCVGKEARSYELERCGPSCLDLPSRSMSYSCATLNRSSPSLHSIVLMSVPFESLKVTLMPVPGFGRSMPPCWACDVVWKRRGGVVGIRCSCRRGRWDDDDDDGPAARIMLLHSACDDATRRDD